MAPNAEALGRAETLFHEAELAYEQGRLADALVLMSRSYEISRAAQLLFNLGEIERELRHCSEARQRYRQYLDEVPNGGRRRETVAAIAQLTSECPEDAGRKTPPTQATTSTPGPAPRFWTPLRTAGGLALGAGVLAAMGAVIFGVSASNAQHDYEALASSGKPWDAVKGMAIERDGQRDEALQIALALSAAGLAAGGAVMMVLGNDTRTNVKPSVDPAFGLAASTEGAKATCLIRF